MSGDQITLLEIKPGLTWGSGEVAFLHPNHNDKTEAQIRKGLHLCLTAGTTGVCHNNIIQTT